MDQSTPPPIEPYALSVKEAAERLSVNPSTLYRHYGAAMARGEIQTLRIGTAVRVVWTSLLAYIEEESRRNG